MNKVRNDISPLLPGQSAHAEIFWQSVSSLDTHFAAVKGFCYPGPKPESRALAPATTAGHSFTHCEPKERSFHIFTGAQSELGDGGGDGGGW